MASVVNLSWASGDQTTNIQAAATSAGVGGVVIVAPGTYDFTGNITLLDGQTWKAEGTSAATFRMTVPITSSNAGFVINSKSNVTIENLTFDGNAFLRYNYAPNNNAALPAPATFSAVSGKVYKITIRAAAGATLTASGAVPTTVATGIGTASGAIVQVFATATSTGTVTLTPSGNVYYVSVMENGGTPGGLLSAYQSSGVTVRDVNIVNMDSFGISFNNCQNTDILAQITRSAASWEQNVGILIGDTSATSERCLIRSGTVVTNTGITLSGLHNVVEAGVKTANVGYSSSCTVLTGSAYIGQMVCAPNAAWPDQDDTVPSQHEVYGTGTLDCPIAIGHPGSGISIGGKWQVISPIVADNCSYFTNLGNLTAAGMTFLYTGSADAAGSVVTSPQIYDTRAGNSRTQCVGIADLNSSVHDTIVLDANIYNCRTAQTAFLGATNRIYRPVDDGVSVTYTPTITSFTGSFTTVTAGTCRYQRLGKRVRGQIAFTLTNAGTGGGAIQFTVPTTPLIAEAVHGHLLNNNKGLSGRLAASGTATVVYADGTNPIVNGSSYNIHFDYEEA